MVKEALTLYYKDASGQERMFPNETMPARLDSYTYSSKRMGNAPTIQGTLQYPECLDSYWLDQTSYAKYYNIFVKYREENYYIDQTPTSSKDNTTLTYKHELNFVSERIILEHTLFLDVVSKNPHSQYKDRVRSNETSFQFYGDINELTERINDSLDYTGTGYDISIDRDSFPSDYDWSYTAEISFDAQTHFELLNQLHETFNIGFYFVGKHIFVGEYQNHIETPIEYGSNGGLLSVTKTNTNEAIVDRITGVGGDKNIPYYYPNPTPYGTLDFDTVGFAKPLVQGINKNKLDSAYPSWDTIEGGAEFSYIRYKYGFTVNGGKDGYGLEAYNENFELREPASMDSWEGVVSVDGRFEAGVEYGFRVVATLCNVPYEPAKNKQDFTKTLEISFTGETWGFQPTREYSSFEITHTFTEAELSDNRGSVYLKVNVRKRDSYVEAAVPRFVRARIEIYKAGGIGMDWGWIPKVEPGRIIPYKDLGVIIKNTSGIKTGDKIIIRGIDYVQPLKRLMPRIYFDSDRMERFYNADNNGYSGLDSKGNPVFVDYNDRNRDIDFNYPNPYRKHLPHEHKEDFDDIYPTIKDMENYDGKRIGTVVDVAFDEHDDDSLKCETITTTSSSEYNHPYFYMKIPRTSFEYGDYDYNLFEQAIENETMKICMTSGDCAGCEFEVRSWNPTESEETGALVFRNPVNVDASGNLVKGDWEQKILGSTQEEKLVSSMQNTALNEVWLVLSKEESTFSHVMPSKAFNARPKPNDTFVITGISMPQAFIHDAELRLEHELLKYMREHNEEIFNFSATFSRVFIANNESLFGILNENSKMVVLYNGVKHNVYVTSYSCKADTNCLYDVSVELGEELKARENTLAKIVASAAKASAKDASAKSSRARVNANSSANVYTDTQISRVKAAIKIIEDDMAVADNVSDSSVDNIGGVQQDVKDLDKRFLRKDTDDSNGENKLTLGGLEVQKMIMAKGGALLGGELLVGAGPDGNNRIAGKSNTLAALDGGYNWLEGPTIVETDDFVVQGQNIYLGDYLISATPEGLKITKWSDGSPANIIASGDVVAFMS